MHVYVDTKLDGQYYAGTCFICWLFTCSRYPDRKQVPYGGIVVDSLDAHERLAPWPACRKPLPLSHARHLLIPIPTAHHPCCVARTHSTWCRCRVLLCTGPVGFCARSQLPESAFPPSCVHSLVRRWSNRWQPRKGSLRLGRVTT